MIATKNKPLSCYIILEFFKSFKIEKPTLNIYVVFSHFRNYYSFIDIVRVGMLKSVYMRLIREFHAVIFIYFLNPQHTIWKLKRM